MIHITPLFALIGLYKLQIEKNKLDYIKDKFSKYLSNGIPIFYENLINGTLIDYNPNEIDGIITKVIIDFYYGKESYQSQTFKDFLKGTQNDIGWAETIIEKIKSDKRIFIDPIIDVTNNYLPEINDPDCYKISNKCKIAIISDWAIGTPQAYDVIVKINKLNPDYLIYLGDVYYSGTIKEFDENFFEPIKKNLNPNTRIFFIPGNHDYYSGSEGIYYCLNKIGQRTTYFSLYNDYYQFEGFDTGFNESNPLIASKLIKDNTFIQKKENDWHENRFNIGLKANRKITVLTHHPPITSSDQIYWDLDDKNRPSIPINTNLLNSTYPYMENISLWFFGHTHGFNIYEDYNYLDKIIGGCRLIGNGSCQSNADSQHINSIANFEYESEKYQIPKSLGIFPDLFSNEVNATFVIIDLYNENNDVQYYQIPQIKMGIFGEPICFYNEKITKK